MKVYRVDCAWDEEARVWYVTDSDVPGLITEADRMDEMEAKLRRMVPELLELNRELVQPYDAVPFDLITRKRGLAPNP